MTWEDLVANAKKNNATLTKSSSTSKNDITTKSTWEDLVASAKRSNAAKQLEEQKKLINSNEYKWASENESRLKKGLGYNVNNGQIYSFEPLTTDSLKKSIDWADSEIEKLKSQGASTDWITAIGNFGLRLGGMEGVDRKELNQQLSDLQSQRAVYQKYLENAEYEEAMAEIKKNGDGESFSELFAIDSRKKTLLDALSNIGSGGNIIPSGNSGDIAKEAEIEAELKNKYGENYDKFRELYGKGANNEFRQHLIEKMKEDIDEHPVLGTVGYTLGNVVTAPVRGMGAVSDSLNKAMGNYGAASGSLFQDMSEATVQKVNENINKTFKNDFAAGFVRTVYNAAVSGAESMISMGTFGKMGEAILGLNAATSTYKAGKERGLSDGQALAGGIAAGIFESLFEHMSLENLRMFKASPVTSLKPFIKNVIKQAGIEGIEEIGTDLANEAYDYFVNGGLSQYEEALRSGMTAEEYGKKFGLQLLETGLTGALSGGGMIAAVTAPTAVSGSMINAFEDAKQGYDIAHINKLKDDVLADAKETGGILGSRAARIEKRIADGKDLSYRKLGEINRKIIKKQRELDIDKVLSENTYKELSGKEKNFIRSSVLTYLNDPKIVSSEQQEILRSDNAKDILKKMQALEYSHMEERDSKRIAKINSEISESKEKPDIQNEKSEEIRTAVFEGNTEKLVKNSFDAVNIDGHRVEIGAVKDITDGELELIQDKETGATAKLSEIRIEDEEISGLYAELQKSTSEEIPMTVEAVNVALSMYNRHDNTSGEAYAKWAYDAFKAASLKINDTVLSFSEYEEMMRGDISKGESNYTSDITKSQLRQMYELGAKSLVTKPGVTKIGTRGLSTFQAEQVFIIDQIGKKYGLEFVLVDNRLKEPDGQYVNGYYKSGTNRIVLSLQSEMNLVMVTAGHELFHWAKEQNESCGAYLQRMVIGEIKSNAKYNFDKIFAEVSEKYRGLSEDAILEEIAAQYLGVALSNEATVKRIVDEADTKEKTFLENLVLHLKEFIGRVKKLLNIYGSTDSTVRAAVNTPIKQLEEIARQFEVLLNEAAKNKKPTTEDGGVKYSKQKPKKNSAKTKKSYYNEIATTFMIWANSESTPVGSVLRQKIKGKIHFYFKTENGAVEISKRNYVEKDDNYGKIIDSERNTNGKTDSEFSTSTKRRSNRNVPMDGNRGNAGRGNNSPGEIETGKSDTDKRRGVEDDRDGSAKSSESSEFQNNKGGYKLSRQFISETEDNITQMKAENESFFQYLERLGDKIGEQIKAKRTPGSDLIYDRRAFYEIAERYNLPDSTAEGWFESSKYSDTEIVNAMENIMVGISDGLISSDAGLSRLARIQEDILRTGYELKYGNDRSGQPVKENVAKSFRQDLRNKPIYVSRYTYDKLIEQYKTRKNLRSASFNQLSIREEDGINTPNIETLYREMLKKYPDLLNEVSEPFEMISELINTERAVHPQIEYVSEKEGFKGFVDLSEAAVRRAADMLTEAFNVDLIQGDLNKQYEELRGVRRTLDRTKKYYSGIIKDAVKIRAEREQKGVELKRIIRITRRLDKMLRKGTDYNHIPEDLKKPVAKFLQVITGSITNTFGESLVDGSLTMAELYKAYEGYGIEGTVTIDEVCSDKISHLQFVLNGDKKLKDLTLDELREVEYVVTHFNFLVNEGNRTFIEDQKREYEHTASISTEELEKHKENRKKGFERIKDAEYHMLTPYMFFKEIGTRFEGTEEVTEILGKLGNDLFKGEEKVARNAADIKAKTQKIMEAHGYDSRWLSDKREFVFESGQKASMTTENIMHILATYDREKSHGFKTEHILAGGIVIADTSHKTVTDYIKPLAPKTIKKAVSKELKARKTVAKKNKGRIFTDMSDVDRANILNKTALDVVDATAAAIEEDVIGQVEKLKKEYEGSSFKVVRTLGEDFGVFNDYENDSIRLDFNYSVGSIKKSINEAEKNEQDINDFAKMLLVFDDVVKNAQLIEIHKDKYKGTQKENTNLKQVYVLLSAFQDGNNIVPVEFVIKEFNVGVKNQLYVSVNLKRIEAEVPKAVEPKSPDTFRPTSAYRIADIISKVNPLDVEFLKYIPASMLSEQQNAGRNAGIKRERLRIADAGRIDDTISESEQKNIADEIAESLRVNISEGDIKKLRKQLTTQQTEYYKALVEAMSKDGAALGNETALKLFGNEKFTEDAYCPVSVVRDYLLERFGVNDVGERRLKNRSFTKNITESANAPVLIDNISEVYAKHMYEMCVYNGMAIPLESIERLLNYKLPDEYEATGDKIQVKKGKSYRELFREAFGDRGLQYLENLMRDLNGGIKTDNRGSFNSMITNFKRSAVSASLTVALQQPSAVGRAMFRIDPWHFMPTVYVPRLGKAVYKKTGKGEFLDRYDELLKYCPVAVIKDIGKFDTNVGQSFENWILDITPEMHTGNSIREFGRNLNVWLPGLYKKAGDAMMWLPGYLDKASWLHIWNAVKRETAHKNGVRVNKLTEKMLAEAGERMSQVIRETQVYDSVLARSDLMRSKNALTQMATAFMAEPTVTYNLIRYSASTAKHQPKVFGRAIASVLCSIILNDLLKNLAKAFRKDDEETHFGEVFLSGTVVDFVNDLNPLTYIPYVKDIWSLFEGYDIERADMSVFSKFSDALKPFLDFETEITYEHWGQLFITLSMFTGIPANNLTKDITGLIARFKKGSPGFSKVAVSDSIKEDLSENPLIKTAGRLIPPIYNFFNMSDERIIYNAVLAGDDDVLDRYRLPTEEDVEDIIEKGYSVADAKLRAVDNAESNFHSKVVEGLISEDIRIKEAAEARLDSDTEDYEKLIEELAERGFDKNDIIKAIDKYIESMKDKSYKASESKDKALYSYEDLFRAIDSDNIKSAKYIFEELTKTVSKATVQNNIRDEYSEALYVAILNGDKADQERLQKIFKEFEYDHHYAVILGLRENDERIYEAAEARYKGDFEEYESIKEELLSDGFDENDIFNAVEAEAEKLAPSEEKKESHPESSYLYEAADLKRYAESFNLTATKRAIQNFRDGGKEDSGIRSSLTSVFKKKYIEAWQSGNDALIIKIRDFLIDCDVGYSSKQFSSWEKEALGK